MRSCSRANNSLRNVNITKNYIKHAEGSVLVEFGDTKVICTASIIDNSVPRFLKGTGKGWLTAEYGMLPRSTHDRMDREASRGKQSGRTLEIQRLIGRSLRTAVDLDKFGEKTIYIDCDVIQADGGTRTASITGSCVALYHALKQMSEKRAIKANPFRKLIASVSVGIVNGEPVLDLEYEEDSNADTDMNVVMDEYGEFIEIQGTAEGKTFQRTELNAMLDLAQSGITQLLDIQRAALELL